MSVQKFVELFANAIEVEAGTLTPQTVFKDLAVWDSLCALSVIAMIDESFNVTVGGTELEKAASLADLWAVVQAKAG